MKHFFKIIIFVCLLLPLKLKSQSDLKTYQYLIENSITALQESRNSEAEQQLDSLINIYQTDEQLFAKRLYLGDGLSEKQMNAFVTKSILYTQACFFKGLILLKSDRPYEALINFKISVESDSSFSDGFLGIADSYMAIYQYPKALEIYTYVLSIEPSNTYALLKSASALGFLKMYDQAVKKLDQAIKLDSTCTLCYQNKGYYLLLNKEYDNALIHLDMTLKAEPNDPYALNNKGFVLHKLNESKEGLKLIDASLKTFPDNHHAYLNKALIYLDKKKQKEACGFFSKAISLGLEPQYNDRTKPLVTECPQ
ncbi:hypothetical protein JMN32_24050 [Fulvivirga sp. 29W222]|uniref:Tetratricopeptide repeat protein n=1 Tax=Fulvivirga marina TaxID=2494733 RepID=A0A937G360_9BACT|nr:tetratricopeptide repeat protein [Fulvivirga marina]MBL6449406.1 hypothetical protein [Fulvivirga marina]